MYILYSEKFLREKFMRFSKVLGKSAKTYLVKQENEFIRESL